MEIGPSQSNSQSIRQKSDALRTLSTNGSISSSISKLSSSSRVLPTEKDFHFYYNFDEFRAPLDEIGAKSQSMLEQIGSSKALWGNRAMSFPEDVEDDAYDWLVNVNDEVLERFDTSVDEFSRLRKADEEAARSKPVPDESGFQLVCGRKKKGSIIVSGSGMREKDEAPPGVRVAERDTKTVGPKHKVPFHLPTIRRPQEEFNILVNNSNQPFQHVWLERSEDGSRFVHPLENLSVLDFVDQNIESLQPIEPPPLESTPFKLVEEVKDLKELAAKLRSVNEFAVDLEHNQYRSFQGITCLMQISTRTEDFVVDTFKLRIHIGPYMRDIFKDPTKKKVMHGADRDIIWLQRDFGIYVCNLFDTGQASRVLQLERNSLEYLLQHFCDVTANKEYQNADWRLRPLPEEMLRYAREDTHYLLYIYDLMRMRLLTESENPGSSGALLLEVYKRSYDVCIQLYEKELLTETSYLYVYGVQGANLNAQQLSVVAGLCGWRDAVAREEDESTGYILPNKILLEIAKQMPLTANKLKRLVRSKHPYVERNLNAVVNIIRHSVQNSASFEAVVEQLKEGRVQAPELDVARADFPELQSAGDYSEGVDNFQPEDVSSSLPSNPESCRLTSHLSSFAKDTAGVSTVDVTQNGYMRKDINGSNTFGLKGERGNTSITPSEKVAEVTVQVLKKPNRGFGALLGKSGSKKGDFQKEKIENKLEQIKSSVNLPFYSFSRVDQESKHVPEQAIEEPKRICETVPSRDHTVAATSAKTSEDIILLDTERPSNNKQNQASDISVSEESPVPPASSSKLDDVILLDSDSNDEELADDDIARNENQGSTDDVQVTTKPDLVVLDEDDEDGVEPMSLSDLSSSFQKCLQSVNQSQTTQQDNNSKYHNFPQFKPFDFEAARKEVKFGEEAEKEAKNSGDSGKNLGKKKNNKQEEDGLPQGRRRQAFPASGNRSATFR